MDLFLFCLGWFLILLSGSILRKGIRMNSRYLQVLRNNGIDNPSLPLPAIVVPMVWSVIFLGGVAILAWAWVR